MHTLLALVLLTIAGSQAPRGEAEISLNGATLAIEYGRPDLDGRDMIESAPVGTVWRLGADEATTMTIQGTAVFGNMVAQEGAYSLFVERLPGDRWSLVVNSQTGQWGTEHDRSRDVLGIPLKWEKEDEVIETLTIDCSPESGETAILTIALGRDRLKQRVRLVGPGSR